ncbi:MAG: AAA family ATPase [Bacteroidales bacterium]|nr:AAA family ATPase [Bacteroidales bacterium]
MYEYFEKHPEEMHLPGIPSTLDASSASITPCTGISPDYRPYITAIKSKPFLLLAGISGSGKSRIVRELARACWEEGSAEYEEHKPRNFEMVQVKPNWHDSSELIGYVSRVSGKPEFIAGDFLKFVAKAWSEPDVPYFLCLDEMNLAPVEQYFAEYLSVVESRKNKDGVVVTDPIIKKSPDDWFRVLTSELTGDDEALREQFLAEGISLPQNLIVVGTVNMDETTFSFSRKVLDRAMTIEMNEVDLRGGLDRRHDSIGKIEAADIVGSAVEGVDVYGDYSGVCDKAITYLEGVNAVLDKTPFKIGYRTRNEFLLYVVNNLAWAASEAEHPFVTARALDEITSMKILSRIEGDETKVSTGFLGEVEKAIEQGLKEVDEGLFDATDDKEAYASISLAKLDEMKKRLKSGYTSFWS